MVKQGSWYSMESTLHSKAAITSKVSRTSYGILALQPEVYYINGKSEIKYSILSVKQHVSYAFRQVCYMLRSIAKTWPIVSSEVTKIVEAATKLSDREYGILITPKLFDTEIQRLYTHREYHWSPTMKGRALIEPHLPRRDKMVSDVKERRWSPPKGGPINAFGETIVTTIEREVEEETGLYKDKYTILKYDPIELSYVTGKNSYYIALRLFFTILHPDVYVRRYDELVTKGTGLKPKFAEEIERVANVPLEKLDDLYPLEYGTILRKAIEERLSTDKTLLDTILTYRPPLVKVESPSPSDVPLPIFLSTLSSAPLPPLESMRISPLAQYASSLPNLDTTTNVSTSSSSAKIEKK